MSSQTKIQFVPVISGLLSTAAGARDLAEGNIQRGTLESILGLSAVNLGTIGHPELIRETVIKTAAITGSATIAFQGLANLCQGRVRKGLLQATLGLAGAYLLNQLPSRAASVFTQTFSVATLSGLIAYQGMKDLAKGHFGKGIAKTAFGLTGIALSALCAYTELSPTLLGDRLWHRQPIHSGVDHYTHYSEDQRIQFLKVDPAQAQIQAQDARSLFRDHEHPPNDRLILSDLTSRVPRAVGSINGGFFHFNPPNGEYYIWNGQPYVNGDPIGELIIDHKTLFQNPQAPYWGTFAVSPTGQISIADSSPPNTRYSLGAAPLFIRDGNVLTNFGQPAPFQSAKHIATPGAFQYHMNTPHGRTAVCQDEQDQILLVAAEGRMEGARGFTIPEFGSLLKALGCRHALNLDGGGSVDLTFLTESGAFSSTVRALDPCGKRTVATALVVTK